MNKFQVNDVITPSPDAGWPERVVGQCYRIVKVPGGSRKNYQADPIAGGKGITGPEWAFLPWDGDPTDLVALEQSAPPPVPPLGAVVQIVGQTGYWVVIGVARSGGGKVARLGGDDNRYLTNVSPRRMTVVELDLEEDE